MVKSSLVKAGLLPQLKGDRLPGSSQWEIASFTPGEHPLGKLVDILTRQQQQNQPHLLFIDQFESTASNNVGLLKKGCDLLSDYLNNNNARNKYVDVRQICQKAKGQE